MIYNRSAITSQLLFKFPAMWDQATIFDDTEHLTVIMTYSQLSENMREHSSRRRQD